MSEKRLLADDYGKKLSYTKYSPIESEWTDIIRYDWTEDVSHFFGSVQSMTLRRNTAQGGGLFNIYRFLLIDEYTNLMRAANSRPEVLEELSREAKGVTMSNVGGLHGYPRLFQGQSPLLTLNPAARFAHMTVELAEKLNAAFTNTPRRDMQSIRDSEAWLNVNSAGGDWNRMHHHGGATWSGVAYIKTVDSSLLPDVEGGNLVIKPSPHAEQSSHNLTVDEKLRLVQMGGDNYTQDSDHCRFVSITPKEGSFVVFPSWLHHGVTSLQMSKTAPRRTNSLFGENSFRAKRVSLAFNMVSLPMP